MSPPEPPPEFFIDRSLGRHHLADTLRQYGLIVHTMAAVYGEREGQRLADEDWLRDVGEKGWVVLMKDDAIRRRPAEREALIASGVRAFCLYEAPIGSGGSAAVTYYTRGPDGTLLGAIP